MYYVYNTDLYNINIYTSQILLQHYLNLKYPNLFSLYIYIYIIYIISPPKIKTSLSKLTLCTCTLALRGRCDPAVWGRALPLELGRCWKAISQVILFRVFFWFGFFGGGMVFWLDGFWMIWVFVGLDFLDFIVVQWIFWDVFWMFGCDVWWNEVAKKTGQASWTVLPL